MKSKKTGGLIALLLALCMMILPLTACNKGPSGDVGPTTKTMYLPEYIALEGLPEDANINQICFVNNSIYMIVYEKIGTEKVPVADDGGISPRGDIAQKYGKISDSAVRAGTDTDGTDTDDDNDADAADTGIVATDMPVVDPVKPGDSDDDGFYEYDVFGSSLYKVNIDGTNLQKLEAYATPKLPEGQQGDYSVEDILTDSQGNVWVRERSYAYHFDDDGNYIDDGMKAVLRKLDAFGAELVVIDLAALAPAGNSYFYINSVVFDKDGNLVVLDSDRNIYVLRPDGTLNFKIQTDDWFNSAVALSDGRIAVMGTMYDAGGSYAGQALYPIDLSTRALAEPIALPNNIYLTYKGSGEYLFLYGDGSNFYGYNGEKDEGVKLFNWMDIDINSGNVGSVTFLPDGRVLAILHNYDYGVSSVRSIGSSISDSYDSGKQQMYEIIILTRTEVEVSQLKTELTLACQYLDYDLRATVIEFNKRNDKYRIIVNDYSEFNTPEDWNAGLTKLATEIISGNVPDMLSVTDQLPLQTYINKGLIADLYKYIDADEKLGRGSFTPGILEALEIKGKLYSIYSSFYVTTAVGRKDVVGDRTSWTLNDLNAVLAQNPGARPFAYVDRNSILFYTLSMGMGNFVNWQTGTCRFNTDDFKMLLEFIKSFPEQIDWSNWEDMEDETSLIASGKVLLSVYTISDFESYQMTKARFGGDISFVGFPTDGGSGSFINTGTGLAMSSKCKYPDVAWSFMRNLLTEDYQKRVYWGIPTNKNVLDEKIKEAMRKEMGKDEDGNPIEIPKGSWGWDNMTIEIYAATQEEIDAMLSIIPLARSSSAYDTSIMEIIERETAAYFAGQKSAADTANIIQSAVSIYVNEQR